MMSTSERVRADLDMIIDTTARIRITVRSNSEEKASLLSRFHKETSNQQTQQAEIPTSQREIAILLSLKY